MSEIVISSYFEDNSGPIIGLAPTIRIWKINSSGQELLIGYPCGINLPSDGNMGEVVSCSPEVKDGFYRYNFTDTLGYDQNSSYVVRVDGGNILPNEIRYQTETITPADAINLEFIADGVWLADPNSYPSSSPESMGGRHNATYESVEIIRISDIPALFMIMDLIRKYNTNRTRINPANNTLTIYDDDCVTPIRVFRLLDSTGTPSVAEVCERTSINGSVDGTSPSGFTGSDGYPVCSS